MFTLCNSLLFLFGAQAGTSPAHVMPCKTKTVQLSTRTTAHDISYRAKRVNRWLEQGHAVVLEVNLRKSTDDLQTVLDTFTTTCGVEHVTVTSCNGRKLIARIGGA